MRIGRTDKEKMSAPAPLWTMTPAVGRQFTGSRPQRHREDPHRDSSTGWGDGPIPRAEHNTGKRSSPDGPSQLSRRSKQTWTKSR
ncbi:hypothetical protein SKAU_G00267630 [Synaphobranchus kaupii]|uniref:Uncharacterized protein n=1 Tax=Synaphobranchus kaupii TaxID=118154 RepID=A0A9Q1EZJ6_SYNKA|nr:hypothetical protein SKAU_G00267630 [Synaphobranchus kaupii]